MQTNTALRVFSLALCLAGATRAEPVASGRSGPVASRRSEPAASGRTEPVASGRSELAGDRVGLYPLALPLGQQSLASRIAVQLHEGAAALPGVRAFDLIAKGSCAPDEGRCLATAARSAGLDEMVSVHADATEHGYRWALRSYRAAAEGSLHAEERGEVLGGPLDLAGALEHGLCKLLGAAPCVGALRVSAAAELAGAHLFVDGKDAGALPLAAPLRIAVGRHAVRLGDDERRVRVTYAREAQLVAQYRGGQLVLVEPLPATAAPATFVATSPGSSAQAAPLADRGATAAGAVRPSYLPEQQTAATREPSPSGRATAARLLLTGGAALLAAGAGVGLFAQLESRNLDARYREGTLTTADASRYGPVHTAGVAATVLAATGAGALAVGGLVLALTPSGAALSGHF